MGSISSVIPPNSRIVSRFREIVIQAPGGAYWRIYDQDDRGCGGPRRREIERVAREDIPEIAYAEPVEPVLVVLDQAEDLSVITRYWKPQDVGACALCPLCAARRSNTHPELLVCTRIAPGDIDEGAAAQHWSEWADVLP